MERTTAHSSRNQKTGIRGVILVFFYDYAEPDQFTDIGISYSPLEHLAQCVDAKGQFPVCRTFFIIHHLTFPLCDLLNVNRMFIFL
jgi:hypothetical protein